MEKNIKDYLHLYLGCECIVQYPEDRDGIKCILDGVSDECATFTNYAPDYYFDEPECGVRPILRQLSDMTEEEEREMIATQDDVKLDGYPEILLKADSGETVRYMLSKSFDLFDLIPAGLAIDKSTLTQKS